MTYLAAIYIYLLNFIHSFIKSSRGVLYTSTILMAIFFGGIYNCADNQSYELLYQHVKEDGLTAIGTTEFGYIFLNYISIKFGLSFQLFRTLIGIIGLLLIQKTALEYTKKYSFVFLLYFIYPFMLDVVQIRNFLSASIIIYSIRFLVNSNNRGNIKYLIGVLIAVSIHYMSIFFLPFLFINFFSIRKLLITAIILVPTLSILSGSTFIPNVIQNIIGEDLMFSVSFYLQRGHWGFIVFWVRQLVCFGITYYCFRIVQNSNTSEKWKEMNNIIIKLNIYLIIICFPLVIFDANFSRLYRNVLFLDYIIISQALFLKPKKGVAFSIIALILCIIYWGLDILNANNYQSVMIPFFESNVYFK